MPYEVGTNHRIIAFGNDIMVLFDSHDGTTIVSASRRPPLAGWTVSVENKLTGIEDVVAEDRPAAITTMMELALQALPQKPGYSTLIPRGLEDMP